jgi:hypothetical protein
VLPALAVVVILGLGLALASAAWPPATGGGAIRRAVPADSAGAVAASSHHAPQVPHVNLAGLRWSDFYGVELPSSAAAGPGDTSGGLAAGFAHDPLGALLAAIDIGVRANAQWGPRIFGPEIRGEVTGAAADALLANCETAYDQASRAAYVTGGQPLGGVDVTEEAFRWVAYTSGAATVDLVSAAPDGQGTVRASTKVEVVWAAGDWKVVAPPGGDWGNSATRLLSLTGYTVFTGQGGGR